ncbi:Regulator of G protein signaling domain containing protein [Amanita muscaria]|uniref:Crg1 n=1 Tax=Amanita muscaria (strain Koide BX008) TaxID=946122 RepID=A0A0C2TM17_AMAMK|nr:hypothetical protein M378DRAFT_8869 [Amanita muscaria Koide BX008]
MPLPDGDPQPRATSSHMMKTTRRGRPFLKDTLDLFATLIVSLDLTIHKQFFRNFPNSFTTDDAVQNLSSLKFAQSNRGPDPREPSRIVTTTTTTTFSMTREMAMAMSQHFMDARLIENAVDPNINLFKERGVYQLTPKGSHVLERFVNKNGINADHLQSSFQTQPICIKLLHLERRSGDDEIIVSQGVITALFRRFAGRLPNYTNPNSAGDVFTKYNERTRGVQLHDYIEKAQPLLGKSQQVHKYCFTAVNALEWLCDFTSIVGREEAAEMAAQFVRFGLVSLVHDKRKNNDSGIVYTVRNSTPGSNLPQGEFRCTNKATYKMTEEGCRIARWDGTQSLNSGSPNGSTSNLTADRSSMDSMGDGVDGSRKLHRRVSLADRFNLGNQAKLQKESNAERLRTILDDINTRHLFREFLRSNFCEENLSFWLDVEDFKRKFGVTSSAVAVGTRSNVRTPGQAAMEKHHESLINTALSIYNRYLAPSSQCELNIDHGLRIELNKYLEDVVTGQTGKKFSGRIEPEQATAFNATQLQNMIKLYERIQTHVFRLMATDSIPKFVKTAKYLAMRNWADANDVEDVDFQLLSLEGSTGSEEVGGAYMTVSQRASEREHRQQAQGGSSTSS